MADNLSRAFIRVESQPSSTGFGTVTTTHVYAEDGTYLGHIGEYRDNAIPLSPTGVTVHFGSTRYEFGEVEA